jgi:hypothetical protein
MRLKLLAVGMAVAVGFGLWQARADHGFVPTRASKSAT